MAQAQRKPQARDWPFQVKPLHSNKCTEVTNSSQAIGAKVQQWDCGAGNNQIWTISGKP